MSTSYGCQYGHTHGLLTSSLASSSAFGGLLIVIFVHDQLCLYSRECSSFIALFLGGFKTLYASLISISFELLCT